MSDADTLLREGDLAGARAALVDLVRTQPANEQARMFLFQLLAINGEWDKASRQLEALVSVTAEAQMLAVTYNQAIAGERMREAVFAGDAEMEMLVGKDSWAAGIAKAVSAYVKGDAAGGDAARDAAFEEAPETPGAINGEEFEWIADADARFGPTFEAILSGRYGLIPFDHVRSIKSEGPKDLRDVVWYPVEILFGSGQSAAAFIPARYPGTVASDNDTLKLGRSTDWLDRDWGQEGLGQRLWTTSSGDDDHGLLALRELTFG